MAARHPFLDSPGPLIFAHRGGAGEGAENSETAFESVIAHGVRFIETDVRATADGHALIQHDETFDRTSDVVGPVCEWVLDDVRSQVRLGDGQAPITLSEALDRWPKVRWNVDIKEEAAIEPFLRAVDAADAWQRVCAASFSTRRVRRLRALGGTRLATSLGLREVVAFKVWAPIDRSPIAAQVPPRSVVPVITRTFVRRAHARGMQVHAWTIDDPEQARLLLDLGVDGIITDRPRLMLERFGTR